LFYIVIYTNLVIFALSWKYYAFPNLYLPNSSSVNQLLLFDHLLNAVYTWEQKSKGLAEFNMYENLSKSIEL